MDGITLDQLYLQDSTLSIVWTQMTYLHSFGNQVPDHEAKDIPALFFHHDIILDEFKVKTFL